VRLAPLPTRFQAKILAIRSRGQQVGEVRYTAKELTFDCLRCNRSATIPGRNPKHTDSWGSCALCGQVYVFHLVPSLPKLPPAPENPITVTP
jgi:hypothetical protein